MNKPKMLLMQVVSVGIQFAIAIWAFGGMTAFFAHRALLAMTIATLVFTVVAMFTEGNVSTGEREDRSNRWVLWAFSLLALIAAFLAPYTDRIGFWTIDGETTRWIGLALFCVGCTVRLWPVFVLGRRFSGLVAIQPGHTLVTTGIYSTVRNPSYLGMMIAAAGWAFCFRSVVGLVLALLNLVPLVGRIRAEERLLRSQFGAEYDTYCAHTWRLVPGLW